MFKHVQEYTDFLGNKRERTLLFNLTETEVNIMQLGQDGGYAESLEEIAKAKKGKDIINRFHDLVLDAYGEISEDGTEFIKSPELRHKFECSAAFNEFFMKVCTDEEFASKFVNATFPKPKPKPQDHLEAAK